MQPPSRLVTLILVSPDGAVVGRLPPIMIDVPWWPEAEPVVAAIRERDGIEVTILRLLEAASPTAHGGAVTYLAEVARPVVAQAWDGPLDDHPLRQTWARPGGPAADLRWADAALAGLGLARTGPAVQVRTWNLSSLWRLPVTGQMAWLKVVPPFFAHEGAVIARLAGHPVPRLLAHDGARILLAEIPGTDRYDAEADEQRAMITRLVDLQRSTIGQVEGLHALGVHDWRAKALTDAITDVVERTARDLEADERATLRGFVDDLPRRFAEIAACGLPDTLLHGDFHPGNTRSDGRTITLLDWGDSAVGHPLLDQPAFLERVRTTDLAGIREHWHGAWQRAVPGARPEAAATLLAPIAAARQAAVYRGFLDAIEPSEWPYHAADPVTWLRRTAALVRSGSSGS